MAITLLRPGIFIQETLNPLPSSVGPSAVSVASFVGAANQGPTTPTFVSSWAVFQTLFGGFSQSTYLAQAVYTYFLNNGSPCYVTRVAHTDVAFATRVLDDTAGTPLPTLTLNAYSPGAWGNGITVDITAGYVAGRFNLIVHYGGNVVEQFQDLSMSPTDGRYAPAVINSGSQYVTAVDDNSVTAAPNNAPALQTGTTLATGANGGTIVVSDYVAVQSYLAAIPSPLVLNLTGVTDLTTINDYISWLGTVNNVFLVVDPPSGESVSEVETFAATLTSTSYAAVYYPWLVVPDPTKPFSGGATLTIPPGGAVLSQYVTSDAGSGPWQTPAGVSTVIGSALGLAAQLQQSDYDSLNSANPPVNAIKNVPGYGICLYGGRTLQGGLPSLYIAIRRALIYIEQSLINLTQFAVFQPNDAALWSIITADIDAFLTDLFGEGALAGSSASNAFFVICDASNNTPATVAQGIVNVTVGVALEYPAEFIVINIGQYAGGTNVSNSLDSADSGS